MNSWGRIVGIKGKTAIVSIKKTDEYLKCKSCRPGRTDDEIIVEAKNRVGGEIGDTVEISDSVDGSLGKLFVDWGVPLTDGILGGFIGYVFARMFNQMDKIVIWVIITGIICMALSYKFVHKYLSKNNHIKSETPMVTDIVHRYVSQDEK